MVRKNYYMYRLNKCPGVSFGKFLSLQRSPNIKFGPQGYVNCWDIVDKVFFAWKMCIISSVFEMISFYLGQLKNKLVIVTPDPSELSSISLQLLRLKNNKYAQVKFQIAHL